jgi:hypothetical protein
VALIVFTVSMFISAALLFLVEPMMAKMALPMLGGTPAVWNTCLVFFQAVLLAGYLYAFATTKWLKHRAQIALHVGLALTPFVVLPLHIPIGWEPPVEGTPVFWILGMLSVAVGLPFFLLSASTPILQRWFGDSGQKYSTDPYFLYAASNAGSLVGLLGYPLLLEPTLRLSVQCRLWSYGYALFVTMTVICAVLVWRPQDTVEKAPEAEEEVRDSRSLWRQRFRWIALAFVPSSLMLGVTTALTTDVPAIPLFWVLPLALYLLSFVLVFAKRQLISHTWLIRRLPLLILASLIPTVSKGELPMIALLLIYLLTLFAAAMVCHGELALSRPGVSRLTEYYLWISFGGVLGGIFNSLIAPMVFSTVLEFPIALILAALLRPAVDVKPAASPAEELAAKRKDWLLPLALGLCMVAVITGLAHFGFKPSRSLNILVFGYSMLWCMSFGKRPLRFAAGVTALVAASFLFAGPFGRVLHTERSFFGVLRVSNDSDGKFRSLFHGVISHGMQSLNPANSREPLTYYTRSGPVGSILHAMQAKTLYDNRGDLRKPRWAVVGLGAGAMACYTQPGESLTYYEIDPSVSRIAENPRYFTFLEQCAPKAQIILGDARLKLRDAPDGSYDLLALDAFSGDSIPMHLMTREALALYLRKLAPGGILAFHISSLYLQIAPTLGALAKDAGLVCLFGDDTNITQAQIDAGKFPSKWVVMARSRADLGEIGTDPRWVPIPVPLGAKVWTDDYSNLLTIIKWN